MTKELLHTDSHISLEDDEEDHDHDFSIRHLLPKSYVHRVRQDTAKLLIYEYTPQGEFHWREMSRFDVYRRSCDAALQAAVDNKVAHMQHETSRSSTYQRVGPIMPSATPSLSRAHTPPTTSSSSSSSCSSSSSSPTPYTIATLVPVTTTTTTTTHTAPTTTTTTHTAPTTTTTTIAATSPLTTTTSTAPTTATTTTTTTTSTTTAIASTSAKTTTATPNTTTAVAAASTATTNTTATSATTPSTTATTPATASTTASATSTTTTTATPAVSSSQKLDVPTSQRGQPDGSQATSQCSLSPQKAPHLLPEDTPLLSPSTESTTLQLPQYTHQPPPQQQSQQQQEPLQHHIAPLARRVSGVPAIDTSDLSMPIPSASPHPSIAAPVPNRSLPPLDASTFTDPRITDRHREASHYLRHHALTKPEREEALQHTLNKRDIRKIDTTFLTSSEPAILVRKHAVLLNLIYVKAVIFHNAILILPPEGADDILVTLRDQLMNRDQDGCEHKKEEEISFSGADRVAIPFEMIAYEAIFATAIELLLQAFREVKSAVQLTTAEFKTHTASSALLNQLGEVKKSHRLFQALVEAIRDAIAATLASDEDMWQMNLTKIYKNPEWFSDKAQFPHHQQIEMFLESYLESIEGLVRQMDVVEKDIEATEMLINIQLDVNRNRILAFELTVSTFTMALGLGAVIAGIFGMNMDTGLFDPDPTHFWFKVALISIAVICVISLFIAFFNLQRLGVVDTNQGWWRLLTCRRPTRTLPIPIRPTVEPKFMKTNY